MTPEDHTDVTPKDVGHGLARAFTTDRPARYHALRAERLGHLAIEPEIYLCERDAGYHDGHADRFWFTQPIANRYLATMWARLLDVDYEHEQTSPGFTHVDWSGTVDRHQLVEQSPPHLTFTDVEHERGQQLLRDLGVPEGATHVCVHARDDAYLAQALPGGTNWAYHNHRDTNIDTYLPAMRTIADQGHHVIRVGAIVNQPLPEHGDPRIIDYPTSGLRTDFGDIYLAATCRWMLASPSGPATVAAVFRRPIALANCAPFLTAAWPPIPMTRLFIPKLYWANPVDRVLTLGEIVRAGLDNVSTIHELAAAGVEVRDNTADELAQLAVQMDGLTAGDSRYFDSPDLPDPAVDAFWATAGITRPAIMQVGAGWLADHATELGL